MASQREILGIFILGVFLGNVIVRAESGVDEKHHEFGQLERSVLSMEECETPVCSLTTVFGIKFSLNCVDIRKRVFKSNPMSEPVEFKIYNYGPDSLMLLGILPRPQITIIPPSGNAISQRDSVSVRLVYRPIEPDTIYGCLNIALQNLKTGEVDTARLPYRGIALSPQIQVNRRSIDFGDVALGKARSDTLVIRN
ncbi:MAG: hypothetical protein ACREBU_20565, partial [Nitrososphaera sp.]